MTSDDLGDSSPHARFLLTFDDGPNVHSPVVLECLSHNAIQREIKGVFFVQMHNAEGGGSKLGRLLLEREHDEGHALGLHTATPQGHISHTSLRNTELTESLQAGIDDLNAVIGDRVRFVRPPYWKFNEATLECYRACGLQMVLSELKAYDGVNWGIHRFRRWNLRVQLKRTLSRYRANRLPVVEGCVPIVATFHDTNPITAAHLEDYLCLLVDEADRLGIPLGPYPFYSDRTALAHAAGCYASHRIEHTPLGVSA